MSPNSEATFIPEPPNKKIKNDLLDLINECYDLMFKRNGDFSPDVNKSALESGVKKIRETLERATSSSDVSFGATKPSAKINWGKCLALLLEDGVASLMAVKILTEKLNPGGGLL